MRIGNEMEKRTWRGKTFSIAGAVLIALALWQLMMTPNLLQYAVSAPMPVEVAADDGDENANTTIDYTKFKLRLEAFSTAAKELDAVIDRWTIDASAAGVSLGSDAELGAQARLAAVGENYFSLYPRFLLSGRLPDQDELKYGENVIVLDQQLAIKLFAVSAPIDRVVKIGELKYTVIGVARHGRSVGEHDLYSAYIPLSQAIKDGIAFDTMTVSAHPIPKTGAAFSFEAAMTQAVERGQMYDVKKEAMRAQMGIRMVFSMLGAWLLIVCLRKLNGWIGARFRAYRSRLGREYVRDLFGGITGTALASVIGYAVILSALSALCVFAIEPAYIFPEWIPPVIVEMADIQSTFWGLITRQSQTVMYSTIEVKQIEFWGFVMRCGMTLAFVGLIIGLCSRLLGLDGKVVVEEEDEEA